jgi:hypothetical protein
MCKSQFEKKELPRCKLCGNLAHNLAGTKCLKHLEYIISIQPPIHSNKEPINYNKK